MKYPIYGSLICLSLLGGCSQSPLGSKQAESDKPYTGVVSTTVERLNFDDPVPVFAAVFGNSYRQFEKQPLETEIEYRQRLANTGVIGKEVTFLIAPELCQVFALPDLGTYDIVSRDAFSSDPSSTYVGERTNAISILEVTQPSRVMPMSNAFGVTKDVIVSDGIRYMVRLDDFKRFPSDLKWVNPRENWWMHFGMELRTMDPSVRLLLKENKVGLAIHGRIGDLSQSTDTSDELAPTLDRSVSLHRDVKIVSFNLESVFIVDTTSNRTLNKWSKQ